MRQEQARQPQTAAAGAGRRRFFPTKIRRTPTANADGCIGTGGAASERSPRGAPLATFRFCTGPRRSPSACPEILSKNSTHREREGPAAAAGAGGVEQSAGDAEEHDAECRGQHRLRSYGLCGGGLHVVMADGDAEAGTSLTTVHNVEN